METVNKSSKSSKKSENKSARKPSAKVIELKLRASNAKKKEKGNERRTNRNEKKTARATAQRNTPAVSQKRSPSTSKKSTLTLVPAVEAAIAAVPPYLVTPSAEILKSFREAGKRSRDAVRKVEKMRAAKAQFLAKPPKAGKKYALDLRIHSPATQGYFSTGGVEPSAAIVRLARVKGIDAIAVTDFYSVASIEDVRLAAEKTKVSVIPGFDLCCSLGACREVYLTVLFAEDTSIEQLVETLGALKIPELVAGNREYCFERNLEEVLEIIEARGGVVLPTRMDKTPYRQLAIPELVERFGFHAFDLVHPDHTEFFRERWPLGGFTFLSFSNANALAQIGSRIASVRLASPGFAGIKELFARRLTK